MSLQVWLPLNGSLKNQGLNNITVTNNGATINNSGKIGQCYQFGTAASDITLSANAMTSMTTECSICFWIKILSWNTSYATFFQAGTASTAWAAYRFGFLRNNANSTCCFTISNGSTASNANYLTPALELNTWYHIGLCYKTGHCLIYINGILYQDYTTSIVPAFSGITTIKIGRCTTGSNYQTNCLINDFRIYDHCLSQKEVEEISKGLILHYKLNGNNNLNKNLLSNFDTSFLSYADGTTTLFTNQMNSGVQEIVSNIAGAEKCLHLHSNGGQNRMYRTFSLTQGKIYTVSVDYYSTTAKTTAWWGQIHGGDYTAWPGTPQVNYTTPGSWQRLTYTFGPPTSNTTLYFYILCDNGKDCYVKNIKIEEGPLMTLYTHSSAKIVNNDNTVIYDSSGYNNIGILNDTTAEMVSPSARYDRCIKNTQANNSATYLLKGNVNVPESNALTFAWWMNPIQIGTQTSGLFSTSSLDLPTDYNTTAANMRDSCFDCCNTSGTCVRINVENYLILDEWHHYALVYNGSQLIFYQDGEQKVTANQSGNLKAFTSIFPFYSKAGGVNRTTSGSLSDFRIYVTALTASQIKELYNTSASIDNLSNIYAREYIEFDNFRITKTGRFQIGTIYDDDNLNIASMIKDNKQLQGNTIYEY